MTSEDDIKGLVSLKFLRPWFVWMISRGKGGGPEMYTACSGEDYRIAEIGILGASYQSYTPHCILSIAADARLLAKECTSSQIHSPLLRDKVDYGLGYHPSRGL